MKKLMFINLGINCGYVSGMNNGIVYLVPIAKRYSYEVSLFNIRKEITPEKFEKQIKQIKPSIIAFSAHSQQLKYLIKYSKILTKFPWILQIAGGVGPTLDPISFLKKSYVNGVCVGEGEVPFNDLLNNLTKSHDIYSTKGFYWKKNDKIIKNSIPSYIEDLSTLDFPDYSIFERNLLVRGGRLSIAFSRGCIYRCHYCCNQALSNVYPNQNKYFRLPSVEHSIQLLENLIKSYPEIKRFEFEDSLLIADKKWFLSFAEEYRKRIKLPYRIEVRGGCIDKEIVESFKKSGCIAVYMGIECGNEEFRKKMLNRYDTNKQILEKCKIIREAGIKILTYNIVGFPFETKEIMEDTLKLARQIKPDDGVCSFFYPYKGTVLYDICKKNNLLKDEDDLQEITNYNTQPSIKMDIKTEKDCIYFQKKISLYLNRNHLIFYWIKQTLKRYILLYDLGENCYLKINSVKDDILNYVSRSR